MLNYCRNCGMKLSPRARFCKQCGLAVSASANPPAEAADPVPEAAGRSGLREPARRTAAPAKRGAFPVIPLALGGVGLALCLGLAVGGVLLFRQILLGREALPDEVSYSGEPTPAWVSEAEEDEVANTFIPRQAAPAETTPESVEGITSPEPVTLALSDGTQARLPGSPASSPVTLSRAANTILLPEQPDLHTSGSMRVLEFDLDAVGEAFAPQLTIPAAELGDLDLATVNVLRVGEFVVNGQSFTDQRVYLTPELDDDGNLVVTDGLIGVVGEETAALQKTASTAAGLQLVGHRGLAGSRSRAAYTLMTFQDHLEWSYEPRLVRMIPDAAAPGYRRPARLSREADQEVLQKPVVNAVVLVHGHNEAEGGGSSLAGSELQPWGVAYKQDVWTMFYKTYLEEQKDQVDCTAFYEFIYPTYRPAYSPLESGSVEPLGDSLAKALAEGAKNDGRRLEKMMKANMPFNLYMLAHSMGGLVARAGIREFSPPLQDAFQQLVTWGTPHHGSPLVSMGYLFREGYRVNMKALPDANWYPAWMEKTIIDLLAGSDFVNQALDYGLQLDTPGTRDLRWDNFRPLRLDQIFTDETNALVVQDPNNKKYSLVDGTWLYNDNLRVFNATDPYRLADKYTFIYGVTSKRAPESTAQTAVGATFIPILLRDGDSPAGEVTSGHPQGASDGAVPISSMAGAAIVNFRSEYIGEMDHEEYFSAAGGTGEQVAIRTFARLGLEEPRCHCAEIELESVGDLKAIAVGAPLEVKAQLRLDPDLDPRPGQRIERAEAIFYIAGTKDEFALGELDVEESGRLTGSFPMPDLGDGQHQLVVRARFVDGTQLESTPEEKALYTGLYVLASPVGYGSCYQSNGETTSFNYNEQGKINWTGGGGFYVDPLVNNEFVPIVLEKLSGSLSPDGKSLTLDFEYVYHDETGEGEAAATYDESGNGSFIDIPFVENIVRDGLDYDRFVVEGDLGVLRPHMQFWHREGYTTSEGPEIEEISFDGLAECDGPGKIEVWMFISGRDYGP